jgi:hypothetical protein
MVGYSRSNHRQVVVPIEAGYSRSNQCKIKTDKIIKKSDKIMINGLEHLSHCQTEAKHMNLIGKSHLYQLPLNCWRCQ